MIRDDCPYYTGDEDCNSCSVRGYIADCTGCNVDIDKYNQFQCLHCRSFAVTWDADFNLEDYGYEGDGIVSTFHCNNCGADIEYIIRTGGDDDEDK